MCFTGLVFARPRANSNASSQTQSAIKEFGYISVPDRLSNDLCIKKTTLRRQTVKVAKVRVRLSQPDMYKVSHTWPAPTPHITTGHMIRGDGITHSTTAVCALSQSYTTDTYRSEQSAYQTPVFVSPTLNRPDQVCLLYLGQIELSPIQHYTCVYRGDNLYIA